MKLTIVVACVHYSDYLRLTLPTLIPLGRVHIVTSPTDHDTIQAARANGCDLTCTTAWWKEGATFNKAAALNEALTYCHAQQAEWVLSLDSDIMLPPPSGLLDSLDPRHMYGMHRRDCPDLATFDACNQSGDWFKLPYIKLPDIITTPRGPRLWGWRKTANPIAIQGYFQLWNMRTYPHRRFKESDTATKYDVDFAMLWSDSQRKLIPWPSFTGIHLGEARLNWRGRTTAIWPTRTLDYPKFCAAAEAQHAQGISHQK